MKMILSALAASVVLAGFAAPASAEYHLPSVVGQHVDKCVERPSADTDKYVRSRRYTPREEEYIAESRETGSGIWWQQIDREERGGPQVAGVFRPS